MGKVRISDVAREAGVSLGTVSNALNHPDKVRPATLELVNQAVAKLGYVPNQAARQLAGSESTILGLVLPRLDHAFSLQIANGAQSESRLHGYDLLIASAGNDEILENHYMRYFLGAHIAGVLVQPMTDNTWKPSRESTPIPAVYLDVHANSSDDFIAADNEEQGRMVLEHAAERHAHRVTVIGQAQFTQLDLRIRGIERAARDRNIEVEFLDRGDWNSAEDGFAIGSELAKRITSNRPDFIIGLTDVLAAGAIDGVRAEGLAVPGDILVAGCDGNPLAWSGPVPLTTIASPGYEIGRRGVQLLLARIAGETPPSACRELVSSSLLERASTATSATALENADVPDLNLGQYL